VAYTAGSSSFGTNPLRSPVVPDLCLDVRPESPRSDDGQPERLRLVPERGEQRNEPVDALVFRERTDVQEFVRVREIAPVWDGEGVVDRVWDDVDRLARVAERDVVVPDVCRRRPEPVDVREDAFRPSDEPEVPEPAREPVRDAELIVSGAGPCETAHTPRRRVVGAVFAVQV
jgi:hypothetical protein